MKIHCNHCMYVSQSLILDKDKALAEILVDFSKHIITSHQEAHVSILRDVSAISHDSATIVILAKHSKLLDSLDTEDYVQAKFSELVDKLQDCLGVEVFDNKPSEPSIIEGTTKKRIEGETTSYDSEEPPQLPLPHMH